MHHYPTQNLARVPARFLTLFSDLSLLLGFSALLALSRLNLVELPSLLMLEAPGVVLASGSATQDTLRELIELGSLGLPSRRSKDDGRDSGEYCASSQNTVCARPAGGRTVEGADPGGR